MDTIPAPLLITAREHLEEVLPELGAARRLAVDSESNSFYAYSEKVCLLQISTPSQDYIIDPIAVQDISCLGPLFADPAIEKIFHAGEYDVLCLKRDHRFSFANLFDTMIASRILGFKELGLAAAIERHFGVKLSKKLQRADWGQRPLSPEHIRYAQLDTHYLLRLADIQKGLLRDKRRTDDAAEAFAELSEVEPSLRVFDPEAYRRLAARAELSGAQLGALREIFLFREEQAKSRDRATFRIMSDELMLRLAQALPASAADLKRLRGMTPYLMHKFGQGLLQAVERGRRSPPPPEPPPPPRGRRDMRQWRLFERLRLWRKTQAEKEAVEPVVILPTEALREIARLASEKAADPLAALSPLKRGRYESSLREVLKED